MYYGFDIGGSKIEFGAFDHNLQRVATHRVNTPTTNYKLLVETITQLVFSYDKKFNCLGSVGIGIPGIEDPLTKTILTVNIKAAQNKKLRLDLNKILQREVKIENDANCFALSEACAIDNKQYPTLLGLILGTGFGSGFIVNGKIITGLNHVAGELGHLRLPIDAWFKLGKNAPLFECGCGKNGCLDNYLSGRGFENLFRHYYKKSLTAVKIIELYQKKDIQALEFVDLYLDVMAISLANIFTILDPHIVVLGGGLSNFNVLYQELPTRIKKHLLPIAHVPPIIAAKHGDAGGGVRGAAFLNIK